LKALLCNAFKISLGLGDLNSKRKSQVFDGAALPRHQKLGFGTIDSIA